MSAGDITGEEFQFRAECLSSGKETDQVSAKPVSVIKMNGSERGSLINRDNPDGVASPRTVYLTNGKSVVKQNGTTELQKEPSVSSYSVAQFSPISDAESVETEVDDRLTSNAPKSCSPRRARNFKHEIVPPCYSEVHSSSNLASVMPDANPSSSQPASLTSNDLSTSTGLPHLPPSKSKLHLQPQFAAIDDQPSSLFWSSTGLRAPSPYQDDQLSTPTPQQPSLTTSPSVRPPFDDLSTTEEVADGQIINGDVDRLPPLNLSVLADAAKCVQMEQSLREARDFLDGLLTRLSLPADLCTSFENLLPEEGEEEEAEENRRSEMRRTMPTRLPVPPVSSPPAFSPVFKHLLSLPESQVLSGVSGLTPAYRCLMDLCSQVYAAIDQSKKKLRLIQRIRGRRRREERLERERGQQQSVKLCEVDSSSSSSRRQDSRQHQRQQELTKRQHRFRDALGQLVTAVAASSSADVCPTPSLGSEVWPSPKLASPGYSNPSECPLSFLSLLTSIKVPSPPVVGTDRSAVSTQELVVDTSSPGLQTNYSGLHSVPDLGLSLSVSPAVASEPRSPSIPALPSLSKFRGRRFSGSSQRRKSFSARTSQASRKVSCQSDKAPDTRRSATGNTDFPLKTFSCVSGISGNEKGLSNAAPSFLSLQESQHESVAESLTVVVKGLLDGCPDNNLSPSVTGLVEVARPTSSISPSTSSLTTVDTFSPSIRATSSGGPSAGMSPTTKHRHASNSYPITSSLICLPEEEAEEGGRMPPTSVWVDAATAHAWNQDDEAEGPINHPNPPTEAHSILKLQRIDLDLSDLSDGLRVLLIEDTHLRAGTLYSVASSETEDSSDFSDRTSTLNRLYRIHLDGEKSIPTSSSTMESGGNRISSPGRSSAPKTPAPSPSPLSGRGTERRRQGEALLQAWQLPQQAVLEVIPALSRQLPPGTRVCASWSEKLAAYLYPGRVSDKDSEDTSEPDSVCVSFDDGDEREVHISKIRILPDNFANLAELREAAAFPSPLSPENFARARHASASSALFKSSKRRRRQSIDRLNPLCSDIIETGPLVFSVPRSQSMGYKRRRIRLRRKMSAKCDGPSHSVDVKAEGPCSVANEHADENENRSSLKEVNGTSTVDSAIGATPSILWKPRGRTRRRYQGMNCYRALERKTDGLRVSLGDVVEFNSGRNGTVYLGEVRQICYSPETSAPVVFASWFYYPDEAGPDGRLVEGWKGAIFASSHTDENEAECIIGRVGVAPTLADFRSTNEGLWNHRAKKKTSQPTRSGSLQSSDQDPERGTSRQPKSPSKRRRRQTASQHGRKDRSPESGDVEDEESHADAPRYFVAGRFDPVGNRVLSWDADVARTLNLPSEVDALTFTTTSTSDPDPG